jgi:hypothetical protein
MTTETFETLPTDKLQKKLRKRFNTIALYLVWLGEGNVYLADGLNHAIRKISTEGEVSTFAGTGSPGYLDGPAEEARFNSPINICFDPEGNLLVSDFGNQRIRKISTDGQVTTIAGTGVAGLLDGPALEAQFNYPRGICMDDSGNIYIGDSWNHRIRKISPDGEVSTFAGGGDTIGVQSVGNYIDATGEDARFYTPTEVSIDSDNNLYVADAFNHRIRKVTPDQVVTTLAGSGDTGPNAGGFQNGPGDVARFDVPTTCHVTLSGEVIVGDGSSHRVRKIDTDQYVSTLAGSGEEGFADGVDSLATFNFPRGIVKDYERNRIYVVDFNNHAIRYIQLEEPVNGILAVDIPGVQIFPNPFTNKLNLQMDHFSGAVEIILSDLTGRRVYSQKANTSEMLEMDLHHLNKGPYLLSIKKDGEHQQVNQLILKEK